MSTPTGRRKVKSVRGGVAWVYATVPESWQNPIGPYHQAPQEFGGEWWFVNPFTGPDPWRRFAAPRDTSRELPTGFAEIFGDEPQSKDFPSADLYLRATSRWEGDLKTFVSTGLSDELKSELGPGQVETVESLIAKWGMPKAHFYQNKHGDQVRFPESGLEPDDYQLSARWFLFYPHMAISNYQVRRFTELGEVPAQPHTFFPLHLIEAA